MLRCFTGWVRPGERCLRCFGSSLSRVAWWRGLVQLCRCTSKACLGIGFWVILVSFSSCLRCFWLCCWGWSGLSLTGSWRLFRAIGFCKTSLARLGASLRCPRLRIWLLPYQRANPWCHQTCGKWCSPLRFPPIPTATHHPVGSKTSGTSLSSSPKNGQGS